MLHSMRTTRLLDKRLEKQASRPFNVLILYDQVAAGQRAMHLFSRLGREHELQIAFQPFPWRVDFVTDPKLVELAAADALKADLIIISTTTRSDLPSAVQDWLLACLARMRGSNAAIVALSGTEEEVNQADSPWLEFLRRAAKDSGLDFFPPASAISQGEIQVLPQRWDRLKGYYHGGLNE